MQNPTLSRLNRILLPIEHGMSVQNGTHWEHLTHRLWDGHVLLQEQVDSQPSKRDGAYYDLGVHLLLGGLLLIAVQKTVSPVTLIIEVMLPTSAQVTVLYNQDDLYLEADLLRYRVHTPRIDGTLMG